MHETYSFFNEPYDFQLVLGITLVGIPEHWDGEHVLRHLRTYSLLFGNDPPLGFCGITVQEATFAEPRKAHLICDNLITKQRCLKIRVIPVIADDDTDPCKWSGTVISLRPYCFWVKISKDSPTLPYMLPKYTSSDVIREEFEAKMLLMPNNHRPLVLATLIGTGIISIDHRHWDISTLHQLWVSEVSGPNGKHLTSQLARLHCAVSNFVPHPLGFPDEMIFMSDYRRIFTWTWPWDPRLREECEFLKSCQLMQDSDDSANLNDSSSASRLKRGIRQTGCIRYESNRKRWVVDLSVNGCRMQKCFHENLYGFVGGLQEARRWRLDYIRNTHHEFDVDAEERIVNDLVDKIVALDPSHHHELFDALRTPIKGYEHIIDARTLNDLVDGRLALHGIDKS